MACLFRTSGIGIRCKSYRCTYVKTHAPATDWRRGVPELRLLSRRAFLEKLYDAGFDGRGLIVGFNLPFDFARLAFDFGNTKDKRFAGGFSLVLWDWIDATGKRRINKYRPRIAIKHIDSKTRAQRVYRRISTSSGATSSTCAPWHSP